MTAPAATTQRRFIGALATLCLAYLALQVAYILTLPLVMDEFEGATTVFDLTARFPYRDFAPYKTVLGYYLQLPVLLLGSGPWQPLILVKLEMALLNTAALFAAGLLLRRFFHPVAVVLGLLLTVVMSNFLERSSELRVDMLTSWAGLFSLLFLLGRRWLAAGVAVGISFLLSQKGVYFGLAGGAATLTVLLARDGKDSGIGAPARFIAGGAVVLLVYVALWSLMTSWQAVYDATFVRPNGPAFAAVYESLRFKYWSQSVIRNAGFYAFGAMGLVHALRRRESADRARDLLLGVYGAVLLALSLWHRQPWPYFFVMVVPTVGVLCVSYFDRVVRRVPSRLDLNRIHPGVPIAYLSLGLFLPLMRVPVNLARDNGFQREMITLASCALGPGEGYLAGVDLLYDRWQPIERLAWIDQPRASFLQQLDNASLQALEDSIALTHVKVVVDNYRLDALPAGLSRRLAEEFTPLWGSLRIYGPAVPPGAREIAIRFEGTYSIEVKAGESIDGTSSESVQIDGQPVANGAQVRLSAGTHRIQSDRGVRLRLQVPECERSLDARHRAATELFPSMYAY